MKKNIVTETKARLEQIRERKAKDLSTVDTKLSSLETELADLEKKQERATADLNLSLYEELSEKIKTQLTAISMFTAKKKLLDKGAEVQADESDRTIDALVTYQKDLMDKFLADISEPIASLEDALNAYNADLTELNATISEWKREIGLPYKGGTIIPTLSVCGESRTINDFLNRIKEVRKINIHYERG